MKKTFEETRIEFIFVNADVITTSIIGSGEGHDNGDGQGGF